MKRSFTAGSVGAVRSMVAMLLLHAGMVLRAGVQLRQTAQRASSRCLVHEVARVVVRAHPGAASRYRLLSHELPRRAGAPSSRQEHSKGQVWCYLQLTWNQHGL